MTGQRPVRKRANIAVTTAVLAHVFLLQTNLLAAAFSGSTSSRPLRLRPLMGRGVSKILLRESLDINQLDEAGSKPSTTVDGIDRRKTDADSNDEVDSPFASSMWQSFEAALGSSVDESRLIYPEIDAGQVPRLFSSLEYRRLDDTDTGDNSDSDPQQLTAQHAAGSVIGAAALVAGTTVGAGVLALPAATVATGFVPSTAALLVACVFMTTSGLLIAEKTLNEIARTGRPGLGLLELYKNTLGPEWSFVGTAAYFFLHYAMMVAYIAQGGNNVQAVMGSVAGGLPPQAVFATVVGASLLFTKPALVEKVNNGMVLAVGLSFLGIVAIGAQSADWSTLVNPAAQHPEAIVGCFPILFLALVYQNIVPTVVNNLEGDRTKITQAIVGGTIAPLLMFLAWNAVCLGNVGTDANAVAGLDPVALLQSGAAGGSSLLAPLVTTFSVLALITSLIGFTYGLVDAWTDVLKINQKSEAFGRYRPALYALVYLPPLGLSLTDPNIFYNALEYGGAFGVSTLFLVLPPLMVWKERYENTEAPLITKPMVGLGKLPLGAMWVAASALIVEQAAEKSGLLEVLQSSTL